MFHERLDIRLIRQVRDHPVLYDYNNEKYMDFNAREVAWQRIGDELKRSAAECKIRWINIRDVHRRILRKNLGSTTRKVYKYERELVFMRQFYKDVAVVPIVQCDEEDKGPDWNIMMCDENEAAHDSCTDDSEKPIKKIKENRRKGKKRKETSYEEEEKLALSSTFNDTQTSSVDFDMADPVDAFLLSIGATLKTFSPYHLNIAKSKIFAVVQEHDLQQIVQKDKHEQSDVKASTSGVFI